MTKVAPMLAAASALQICAAVAAGVVAAAITAAVGAHFKLGRWPIVLGVVCIGLLIGSAAADVAVAGVGEWWAQRPIAAAALTGLLLLAVTVLVVETAPHECRDHASAALLTAVTR